MSKRMLIDASHPEETRVVIISGNKVEEFDFESASRKPLKGNIYLAKVTRVEPSLQAAFIEYGGNRHGFLAFSEIHPDYYQIPVADRQALLAAQRAEERSRAYDDEPTSPAETDEAVFAPALTQDEEAAVATAFDEVPSSAAGAGELALETEAYAQPDAPSHMLADLPEAPAPVADALNTAFEEDALPIIEMTDDGMSSVEEVISEPVVAEVISTGDDDALEEVEPRRPSSRSMRHYKIQDVIKKRQILLIQVVKEERGNKGAALTTYLSLAGRYCVLMPNSGRGGGISRKITNTADRRRLKDAAEALDVPEGMGLIVRTAGASRSKQEIERDYDYLLRLWDSIRDLALKSYAPALIYEEGNLIKRAIRDQFSRDIEEIIVEGQEGFDEAQGFTKMIMPHQMDAVKLHDARPSLFQRFKVESQLDSMFNPRVTLKSGGYLIINQTEALVSIDVNSGKATREHHIEDTALKTNLEAAEEVARQLRLRDLAGLVVIDFIDMEENRNDRAVERRLKECLKNDRARIQVGRISPFGLMEMSRQRLRPGVVEGSTVACPHCNGTGLIRSVESLALRALRQVEEEGHGARADGLTLRLPTEVAVYVFNHKRTELMALEDRLAMSVYLEAKPTLFGADCEIELGTPGGVRTRRIASATAVSAETALAQMPEMDFTPDDEPVDDEHGEEEAAVESRREPRDGQARADRDGDRRGNRRRRGRGRDDRRPRDDRPHDSATEDPLPVVGAAEETNTVVSGDDVIGHETGQEIARGLAERDGDRRGNRRRRGRRGGRRNGRPDGAPLDANEAAEMADDGHDEGAGGMEAATTGSPAEPTSLHAPGEIDTTPVETPARIERKSPAAAIARFFGLGSKAAPARSDEPRPAISQPKAEDTAPVPVVVSPEPVIAPRAPEQKAPAPKAAVELVKETANVAPAEPPAPVASPKPAPAAPEVESAATSAEPPKLEVPAAPKPIIIPDVPEKTEIVVIGESDGPAKGGWWKKKES